MMNTTCIWYDYSSGYCLCPSEIEQFHLICVYFIFLVLKGLFSHALIPLIRLFNLFMYSQLRMHAFLH